MFARLRKLKSSIFDKITHIEGKTATSQGAGETLFELLPSDIIWRILDYAPDTLFELKLVSCILYFHLKTSFIQVSTSVKRRVNEYVMLNISTSIVCTLKFVRKDKLVVGKVLKIILIKFITA